jgi:hypothetical protein
MGTQGWLAVVAVAGAFAAPGAFAAIFKCKASDGSLTYQELPCSGAEQGLRSDIASDYPPPNVAERERLLGREAEMYRRLEAQRDRLSAETIARLSRPDPVPVVAEPYGGVIWPAWGAASRWPNGSHRPHSRHFMRDGSNGRLR